MNFFSKNIRKLRLDKGLSQSQFAAIFNIKRSHISAYEDGRAQPKIELLFKISRYFNLSVEDLVSKEMSSYRVQMLNSKKVKKGFSIPLINEESLSDYLKHTDDQLFLNQQPELKLPFENSAIKQCFQTGTHRNIYWLCSKKDIDSVKFDGKHLIITKNEMDIYNVERHDHLLYCTPIQMDKKPRLISMKDVFEVWKVEGYLQIGQETSGNLSNRLSQLESEISRIKSKM